MSSQTASESKTKGTRAGKSAGMAAGATAPELNTPSSESNATTLRVAPPSGLERSLGNALRGFLRVAFKQWIRPPVSLATQRRVVGLLEPSMAGVSVKFRRSTTLNGVAVDRIAHTDKSATKGVVLYLHGGAFCLGSPHSHRSITTRLAKETAAEVVVPDYRLAPEHPYPAAIDDVLAVYEGLLAEGRKPQEIVVAGDSAGGALAAALLVRLAKAGQPMPAGAVLISPLTDPDLGGETLGSCSESDPMLHIDWLKQGLSMYAIPAGPNEHRPLQADLSTWPPTLIQVGELEILRSDSERLQQCLVAQGVDSTLQVYEGLWHVFHLQAAMLPSARRAVSAVAGHVRGCLG